MSRVEIPKFIIPSINKKSKTRLSDSSLYSSLISSCSSSGTLFLDATPPPSQMTRFTSPRGRQSSPCTSALVKVDQLASRRFSEQVRPLHSVPLSQRQRELFPSLSSSALKVKRTSGPDHAFHIASALSSMSLIHDEEPSTIELESSSTSTSDVEPAFENAISISATYTSRKKSLNFSVHNLCCDVPTVGYKKDSYIVKLTLNPGKKRHLLRNIPSSADDSDGSFLPPKRVAFNGVKSTSLSSKILTIKVYAKALLRRTGRLLYRASMPLADVSLTGDANWVKLQQTATQKTAGSISICMCYTARKKKLMITVVNAKSLKMSALRKDSYVEVKLFQLGIRAKNEAMKTVRTKCNSGGSNPVYKEAFSLNFTTDGSDTSQYAELTFTVLRKGFFRADKVLGKVTLSSDMQLRWKKSESLKNTLDEVFRYPGKVITQSHDLSTSS